MATRSVAESWNKASVKLNDNDDIAMRVTGTIAVGGVRTKTQLTQDLSLAPFSYVTSQTTDFYFRGLTINITDGAGNRVNIAEDITVTIDEGDDNFDTPLLIEHTLDENGNPTSSFAFFPDSNITIFGSSTTQLRVDITNANLTGVANVTLYLEVLS